MEIPYHEIPKVKFLRLPDGDHLGWPGLVYKGKTYRIVRYSERLRQYEVEEYEEVDPILEE